MDYRERMLSRERRWKSATVTVLGLFTILVSVDVWNRGGSIGGSRFGGEKVPVGPHSVFAAGMAIFGLVLTVGGVLSGRK